MQREAGLANLIDETVLLGPLERSRLPEAIEGPAHRAGLQFEPGLVARMVDDTRGGDALPLLAYTLQQLHERCVTVDRTLTHAAYDEMGGVLGALHARADAVVRQLAHRGHSDFVLLTLMKFVTLDAEDEPARRRVESTQLTATEREVTDAFVEARLLRSDAHWIEIAHEALLRVWTPLREAIETSRHRLRIEAQLRRLARDWDETGRRDGYLLRDERLQAVRTALNAPAAERETIGLEQEYLDASVALERRTQRAERRRRRTTMQALSAGVLVLAVAAAVSFWQYLRARTEARVADSQRLATQAIAGIDQDPDQSALLALEALRLRPTFEARNAVLTVLPHLQHNLGAIRGFAGPVRRVEFSPDGRLLLSLDAGGTLRRWDIHARRRRGPALRGLGKSDTVAISERGLTVATSGPNGTVRLWSLRTGRELGAPLGGLSGNVTSLAFGHDGKTLASASDNGAIRLWDVLAQRPVGPALYGHSFRLLASVAFSPDDRTLASGDGTGTVRLWSVRAQRPRGAPIHAHGQPVNTIAFSPDGKTFATGASGVQPKRTHSRRHRRRDSPILGFDFLEL